MFQRMRPASKTGQLTVGPKVQKRLLQFARSESCELFSPSDPVRENFGNKSAVATPMRAVVEAEEDMGEEDKWRSILQINSSLPPYAELYGDEAITTREGAVLAILDRLIPPSRDYGHEQAWHDGNGHSHLQATLLGPSLTVPVSEGKLSLGTWQQIFHLECDVRGRDRTIVVTVLGD